ncbi:MAG: SDR family oxidoreductase [Chloroflexota bacterium]
MRKTIFLTGATGFLGCHLAHQFLKQGVSVWALVRSKEDTDSLTRLQQAILKVGALPDEALSRLGVIEGTVHDSADVLQEKFRAQSDAHLDEVWHSAAIFNFKPRDKEKVEATNIFGTQNLLNLTAQIQPESPPRFIYISTAYCTGRENNTAVPEHIPPHIEDFRSIYEWSKHEAECRVQTMQKQYGLDAFILRPSIIIGTPETAVECNSGYYQVVGALHRLRETLVESMGDQFDGNVYTRLLGNPSTLLNLVPIDFVVNGMMRATEHPKLAKSGLKLFNITNEAAPTIGQVHEAVTNSLNIHGLDLVSQADLDAKEMHPIEKIINRRISFQAPYMHETIHFTTDCFRQYVSKEMLPTPTVDVDYLIRLNETAFV